MFKTSDVKKLVRSKRNASKNDSDCIFYSKMYRPFLMLNHKKIRVVWLLTHLNCSTCKGLEHGWKTWIEPKTIGGEEEEEIKEKDEVEDGRKLKKMQ